MKKIFIIITIFVILLAVVSVILIFNRSSENEFKQEAATDENIIIKKKNKNHMPIEITIIFDNNSYSPDLQTDWGFSAAIFGLEKSLLFDTGAGGQLLLENMRKLAIDPKSVETVFLSHIHRDHTGGLDGFLRENSAVEVYLPVSFPEGFKKRVENSGAKIIEIKNKTQLFEKVYSTGEMGAWTIEQSLIIQIEKGLIIITGCAHPGIADIVRTAKNYLNDNVLLVMGGFHLTGKNKKEVESIVADFKKLGVKFVGPCHCSGDLARELFKKEYGKNYIEVGVGKKIEIENLK